MIYILPGKTDNRSFSWSSDCVKMIDSVPGKVDNIFELLWHHGSSITYKVPVCTIRRTVHTFKLLCVVLSSISCLCALIAKS